jgi:hypothetical protein
MTEDEIGELVKLFVDGMENLMIDRLMLDIN